MNQILWPRQDIPEKEKTHEWYRQHADFGEYILRNNNSLNVKMDSQYDSYNGKSEADSLKYIVSTYGKQNKSKYVAYRLSKTKLDILVGEFLRTPLNGTVKTINSTAIVAKTEKYETVLGAMHLKKELEKVKGAGVDVMNGMEIPDKEDPSAFKSMNFNDKNESIMQIMHSEISNEIGLHAKIARNLLDAEITSRCYGRTVLNENTGDMDYEPIDPRKRVCIEFENDPFLDKSPIMGAVKQMPINTILTSYKLTDYERARLHEVSKNPQKYITESSYRNKYSYINGQLCADVLHIEWKSVKPKYSMEVHNNVSDLSIYQEPSRIIDLDTKEYEDNMQTYEEKIAKGEAKGIIVEWEEEMHEMVRIGHDLDIMMRKRPFTPKEEDNGKIINFSYTGMVFNMVNGETVSLKDVCDAFDNMYDVVMYTIAREVGKIKGKIIVYDRAYLPRGQTVKGVLYNMTNDSFIDINSAANGNMGGLNAQPGHMLKEIDLGLSNSFAALLQFKNELKKELDDITGINNAREGAAPASTTVGNNEQNLTASRTITEPLFYYLTKYAERVSLNLIEVGKLVWGIYKPEKARSILGDEKYNFMKATQDLAYQRYKFEMVNPRWEEKIRERMARYAEISLNAKELRPIDMMDFELAETLADAKAVLRNSWNEIEKARTAQSQQQMQADQQNQGAAQQAQAEMMREDREDRQAAELDKIAAKGLADLAVKTALDKNEYLKNQQEFKNSLNGQMGSPQK
jgi:hypothetical protein